MDKRETPKELPSDSRPVPEQSQVLEGTLLRRPTNYDLERSNLARFTRWVEDRLERKFSSYEELWQWSTTDIEGFWAAVWEYFEIIAATPYNRVLDGDLMPDVRWFPGASLNYAQHVFRHRGDAVAIHACDEEGGTREITYDQLYRQTASVALRLRSLGVTKGDRVAALLPNGPETVVAFLATASIGAVWSSCAPEFGTSSVIDRFHQIEPRILFVADGYRYNGKAYDRSEAAAQIVSRLPSLEHAVVVPCLGLRSAEEMRTLDRHAPSPSFKGVMLWSEVCPDDPSRADDTSNSVNGASLTLEFEPVPFEHPLWILFSSGTTGLPKAIVQSQGGILLEHLKAISLHLDLGKDDRFFWLTTTGWMMWNFLVGGLLLGMGIVLYDGSPAHADIRRLWALAESSRTTYFGASAPYIRACMQAGISPRREFDLSRLRGLGSTGSPLTPEGFKWVYDEVSDKLILGSVSGGTDVCTAFVLSCPLLPVRAGEIQCRGLGAKVEAFDERGTAVVDKVGELVLTAPFPSMPIYLWNDPQKERLYESYFDTFTGVWRHGDWIKITERGSCVIYGRSDSTLNRSGVRMGTSEFYRVVERLPEVEDSMVIETGRSGEESRLLLFVVPAPGQSDQVDASAVRRPAAAAPAIAEPIRRALRSQLSPRHVPDAIYVVESIPRTLNGKKLEVPVKRILTGTPLEEAVSLDAMSNPKSIDPFVLLADAENP